MVLNRTQFRNFLDSDKAISAVVGAGMTAGLALGGVGVHQALTEPQQPDSGQVQPVPQPIPHTFTYRR